MNTELIEGAIYQLKVGLLTLKWGEVSSVWNSKNIVSPESNVFYDQFDKESQRHVFGLMPPHTDLYVLIGEDFIDAFVVLVDKENLVPKKYES
jgi:hypothetical protein